MVLIIFGVSVIGYIVGSLAQIMFEGQFQRIIGRKKVEKMVEALKDHYIICGFGRMGSLICREFAMKPLPFVVVEKNPDIIEKLKDESYLSLHGDAADGIVDARQALCRRRQATKPRCFTCRRS